MGGGEDDPMETIIFTAGGKDLGEELVSRGLARIHGMGIGGKTWEEVERLKVLEAEAKAAKRGAWGMRGSYISLRTPKEKRIGLISTHMCYLVIS